MCEHCRKNAPQTKEVSASFSYRKLNDIESEARTSFSRKLTQEEFEDALNQLLIGMKVYAENSCGISDSEFKSLIKQHLDAPHEKSQHVFESNLIPFDELKVPILYN